MSNVLIYGGNGQLGKALVSFFKSKSWTVFSVDGSDNQSSDHSIVLDFKKPTLEQYKSIDSELTQKLNGTKFNAILNVAGGFGMGNISNDDIFNTADLMFSQSVSSSLVASRLASTHLTEGGLFLLTGAAGALGGTSFAIGYGMAKAAVHQLTLSLAQSGSGLPTNAKSVAIAPVMLDTEQNRNDMPGSDFSSWTPLSHIASEVFEWANGAKSVESGKVYKIVTEANQTRFE